jgi:general stress protein 26
MAVATERTEAIKKLRDLIKGINIAMLTTVDESDGTLRSRPMGTQQVEFDGDLWFFTRASAPKVGEVEREQQVNVSYADAGHNRYVSVSGTAHLVRDRKKNQELWNPLFKAWFPEGLDDPDLALLRVAVEKAEYWDSPSGKLVALAGFVKAIATGAPIEGGENEKLEL